MRKDVYKARRVNVRYALKKKIIVNDKYRAINCLIKRVIPLKSLSFKTRIFTRVHERHVHHIHTHTTQQTRYTDDTLKLIKHTHTHIHNIHTLHIHTRMSYFHWIKQIGSEIRGDTIARACAPTTKEKKKCIFHFPLFLDCPPPPSSLLLSHPSPTT